MSLRGMLWSKDKHTGSYRVQFRLDNSNLRIGTCNSISELWRQKTEAQELELHQEAQMQSMWFCRRLNNLHWAWSKSTRTCKMLLFTQLETFSTKKRRRPATSLSTWHQKPLSKRIMIIMKNKLRIKTSWKDQKISRSSHKEQNPIWHQQIT